MPFIEPLQLAYETNTVNVFQTVIFSQRNTKIRKFPKAGITYL